MSVDVEEYFQVWALSEVVKRDDWDAFAPRIEDAMRAILDMLAEADAKATFFTLGWIAERHPKLIRDVAAAGHEIASHGYAHYKVFEQTQEDFFADISRTRKILEDISGSPVYGYRAAGFSIDADVWRAYDALAEAGYIYSSSLHPISHDHYDGADAPRLPFRPSESRSIVEIPVATTELLGRRRPCSGGYFRLLPYAWSRYCLDRIARRDATPATFYFHPWEIDANQPVMKGLSLKSRLRHYVNLHAMRGKLNRLLRDYRWGRMDAVYHREIFDAEPALPLYAPDQRQAVS